MHDRVWQKNWIRSLLSIIDRVAKLRERLKARNQTAVACIVDAANLEMIEEEASRFERVHVITEHSVSLTLPNVVVYRLPDNVYGAYFMPDIETGYVIKKEFNCFLNRIDPIRQSWFYLLYTRGLLDQGYVSFNMHLRPGLWYPDDRPEEVFEHFHKTTLSSFDYVFDDIKKLVPFKNFVDDDNLVKLMLETKFSIVVETYFERTDCRVVSEKTWRAIQLPRPWLLFAATGCIKRLRNMGFDVFDDYIDHSYDDYDTAHECVQRQEAILKEAQRLIQIKTTPEILRDWNEKAKHNRNIMQKWAQNYQQIIDVTFQQIENLVFTN